ncbi:MAG TPA: substrate-binding domain-containing protein [Solirubrobacteraceae bacterium]|jgi:prepilin-type N-terminal cleavage/methylation domain-containing protein|nr:substrate-binding domain-containing protein [Solirubrobacteraceae bacterium]
MKSTACGGPISGPPHAFHHEYLTGSQSMHGRTRSLQHPLRKDETGFTLIELLVVITILGILAAIVVFAVKGIGDKGTSASIRTDNATIRTAEEAYCAKNGSYATAAQLTSAPDKFLNSTPTYNSIVLTSGACGSDSSKSGVIVGSTSYSPTSGELVLGASNTTPPFSFLAQSAPDPVIFSFGASSGLATTAKGGGASVLFASADEANVDAVLDASTGNRNPATTTAATCDPGCPGIKDTKRLYAIGRLVGFSCTSTGRTLAPAAGAPTCSMPTGGYRPALADMADLGAQLLGNSAFKVAIADPGSGFVLGGTPGPTTATCTAGGVPTAPYGVAAAQAMTASTANGGAGLTCDQYRSLTCSGQIIGQSATSPVCGGGAAVTAPTSFNVSAAQAKVVSGATQYGLIPKSFVKSPAGDDTDNYFTVPSAAHAQIKQYAVILNHGTSAQKNVGRTFLNYVGSTQGQAVMAQFGYDPIGAYTPVPTIP